MEPSESKVEVIVNVDGYISMIPSKMLAGKMLAGMEIMHANLYDQIIQSEQPTYTPDPIESQDDQYGCY